MSSSGSLWVPVSSDHVLLFKREPTADTVTTEAIASVKPDALIIAPTAFRAHPDVCLSLVPAVSHVPRPAVSEHPWAPPPCPLSSASMHPCFQGLPPRIWSLLFTARLPGWPQPHLPLIFSLSPSPHPSYLPTPSLQHLSLPHTLAYTLRTKTYGFNYPNTTVLLLLLESEDK